MGGDEMNQKNAIVLSVAINSLLLVFLLVIGLVSEEKEEKVLIDTLAKKEMITPTLFEDTPPAPEKQVAAVEKKVPILEKSFQHKLPEIAKKPTVEKKEPAAEPVIEGHTITVKKGDSLDMLSKEHGVSIEKIMKDNQLVSSFLRIGQTLQIIPEKKQTVIAKKTPEKKVEPSPKEVKQEEKYYIVKYADNPWTIAMKHGIKVNDLLKLNGLDEKKAKKIKPGDRLRIR